MPQLCVLWTHWHHSPSWAVSVNLQEGKELGGALVTFSCFPTPGWVLHFLKRKELCTAESAPGSAHYTSDSQGETSAKASVTDILTSSPTAQLLCLSQLCKLGELKWTLQNSSRGVAIQLWYLCEHNSILNPLAGELFSEVTEPPWEQSGQGKLHIGKGLRISQQGSASLQSYQAPELC